MAQDLGMSTVLWWRKLAVALAWRSMSRARLAREIGVSQALLPVTLAKGNIPAKHRVAAIKSALDLPDDYFERDPGVLFAQNPQAKEPN